MERDQEHSEGSVVGGRYVIDRSLGDGGMGDVYLARDTMLNNECVALKVLHSQLLRDQTYTERFLREVQVTRKVTHPNVVRTFDVGRDGESLFFTMEYVEGYTLKDKLTHGPIDPIELAYILRSTALGLSAIHEAGIIHRDVKPGNVILTIDGEVKIADFGVALAGVSDLTSHNEVIGSIAYLAPEGWVGKDVDERTDIYALGVLAYEALTGQLPFDAESPAEMMCHHLEREPEDPGELRKDAPVWLRAVILKMLSKEQADRFPSAAKLVEVIDRGLEGKAHLVLQEDGAEPAPSLTGRLAEARRALQASTEPAPQVSGGHLGATDSVAIARSALKRSRQRKKGAESDAATISRKNAWFYLLLVGLLSSSISFCLLGPGSSAIGYMWKHVTGDSPMHILLPTVLAPIILYGLFCALPLFIIALSARQLGECILLWLKMSVLTSLMIAGLLFWNACRLEIRAQKMVQKVGEPVVIDVLHMDPGRYLTAMAPTITTAVEAAMLLPRGTVFKPVNSYGSPVLLKDDSATGGLIQYYCALAAFYVLLLYLSFQTVYFTSRGFGSFLKYAIPTMVLLPLTLQYYFADSIQKMLPWMNEYSFEATFGAFELKIQGFEIFCALTNWSIILVTVAFVLPLLIVDEVKTRTPLVPEKGDEELHRFKSRRI